MIVSDFQKDESGNNNHEILPEDKEKIVTQVLQEKDTSDTIEALRHRLGILTLMQNDCKQLIQRNKLSKTRMKYTRRVKDVLALIGLGVMICSAVLLTHWLCSK